MMGKIKDQYEKWQREMWEDEIHFEAAPIYTINLPEGVYISTPEEAEEEIRKLDEAILRNIEQMGETRWNLPLTCEHEWVSAGFSTSTYFCKHCDVDKP